MTEYCYRGKKKYYTSLPHNLNYNRAISHKFLIDIVIMLNVNNAKYIVYLFN